MSEHSNNQIELSHICVVFLTEFFKQHKQSVQLDSQDRIKFLRMSVTDRIKLIEKTIDSLITR
jgi:hypothetical protein